MTKKHTLCLFFVLLAFATVLSFAIQRGSSSLTESEKLAMEALPGYFFEFGGKTIHITRAATHRAFLNQHPMMPYLEIVVDRLEKRPWAKDFAIRIRETETQVVISLPSWGERLGITGPTVFDAGYSLEVTIDKKTKKIVSAFQG